MSTSPDEVGAGVAEAVAALRQRLVGQYGWTHIEVAPQIAPQARTVTLLGTVLVDRLIPAVVQAVHTALSGDWTVDSTGLRLIEGGVWRVLDPGVQRLYARRDGRTTGWGAWIELTERDRVVQILTGDEDLHLVRGRDGTVGWIRGGLGETTVPLALSEAKTSDPGGVVDTARTMLGTTYRLGGATRDGIDCSALVQCALDPLGIVVPRHSSDQLQIDPHQGVGPGATGDLEFAWNEREALCHVGIATGPSIVHASRSRRRVVEDPRKRFDDGARRRMHVPFCSLVEFARGVAGHPSLAAAGFALGRPVSDRTAD